MLGGFSALPCGLATLLEGLLAGLISSYLTQNKLDWKMGFPFGVVGESLHMLLVFLIGRPFWIALLPFLGRIGSKES